MMTDARHDPETLHSGIDALGLRLPEGASEKLLAYLGMLLKWNRTFNLTALTHPQEAICGHLLDSLAVLPWIDAEGPETTVLDVGSGGGLPGIPLAIARPEIRVRLVDAIQKKTAFLQQAVIELGLSQVDVCHIRVEALAGSHAVIVSRAFAPLQDFVALTRHLMAPGGCWLAMKGQYPTAELAALPADIRVETVTSLKVPGLAAERHLVMLRVSL